MSRRRSLLPRWSKHTCACTGRQRLSPCPTNLSFSAAAGMRRPVRLESQGPERVLPFSPLTRWKDKVTVWTPEPAWALHSWSPECCQWGQIIIIFTAILARPFAQHEHDSSQPPHVSSPLQDEEAEHSVLFHASHHELVSGWVRTLTLQPLVLFSLPPDGPQVNHVVTCYHHGPAQASKVFLRLFPTSFSNPLLSLHPPCPHAPQALQWACSCS